MIHVCFPLHDETGNYSKYTAVAMYSLLYNTNQAVEVHLLHDETLREEYKEKFCLLVKKFNQIISFHDVNSKDFAKISSIADNLTIGTLFRLKILEVVPEELEKIIYLDSDIVVALDIASLWNLNIQGCAIGATHDEAPGWLAESDYANSYFNAGVLILNLQKIRKYHDLYLESMKFFSTFPHCEGADQDALNFIFKGDVFYLSSKFNCFTRRLRNRNLDIHEAIFHFSGADYPNLQCIEFFDRLFFSYLIDCPWKERMIDYLAVASSFKDKQLTAYRKLLSYFSFGEGKKKIIFGAKGKLNEGILEFIHLSPKNDYFIDNDERLQNKKMMDIDVFPPQQILFEEKGKFIVIVLSKKYYSDIKKQLLEYGLKEFEDFIDGRLLLEQGEGGYPLK